MKLIALTVALLASATVSAQMTPTPADGTAAMPMAMRATFREAYPHQLALTKLLADSGVRMMVGTDGGSVLGPGLMLRQEFKELADAGIAPLHILQMATVNAAGYLHKSDSMGTIEIGKDADLLLFDVAPLLCVKNLHRIAGVVRDGFHFGGRELDALKARVRRTRGKLH